MSQIAVRDRAALAPATRSRASVREFFQQKSTIAFFFTLPLILLIAILVI